MSFQKKPDWLRIDLGHNPAVKEVEGLLKDLNLHTVCKEAFCPNRMECYRNRSATFMILGNHCSRNCRFCNVTHQSNLPPLDTNEPQRVAEAASRLNLAYVVITSVTRDDLPLGGAEQFVEVIRELKSLKKPPVIEVLIPDFQGDTRAILSVVQAKPRVLNHNIETVSRLYQDLRPEAEYQRSLDVLQCVKDHDSKMLTKSGFMVGVGEQEEEVFALLEDLRAVSCDLLTIGQYLPPSKSHFPLVEYITPEQFDLYKAYAKKIGFKGVASGPLVRSSYHAVELVQATTGEDHE